MGKLDGATWCIESADCSASCSQARSVPVLKTAAHATPCVNPGRPGVEAGSGERVTVAGVAAGRRRHVTARTPPDLLRKNLPIHQSGSAHCEPIEVAASAILLQLFGPLPRSQYRSLLEYQLNLGSLVQ